MTQEQHESTQREYIKLFYSLVGKQAVKNIVWFFGSEENLQQYAIVYYNNKKSQDVVLDSVKKQEIGQ